MVRHGSQPRHLPFFTRYAEIDGWDIDDPYSMPPQKETESTTSSFQASFFFFLFLFQRTRHDTKE
jgi:hypothetical protein